MANSQDTYTAAKQAKDAAIRDRLTSEQQQKLQNKIEKDLATQRERAKETPEQKKERRGQERAAHDAAVQEAENLARADPGANRFKVRTVYRDNTATSRITGTSNPRTGKRSNRQYATSGEPVELEGDPEAITSLRAQAFSQEVRKAQQQGRNVTQEGINRETRNILLASGGQITFVKQDSQAINDYYNLHYSSEATRKQMEIVDAEAKKSQDAEVDKLIKTQAGLGYAVAVTRTDKKGDKTIEFYGFDGTKQYEIVNDPVNPHQKTRREVNPDVVEIIEQKTTPVPEEGPLSFLVGLGDYFTNIPKVVQQGVEERVYGKSDVVLNREIEGELLGAATKAGVDAAKGKPVTLQRDVENIKGFVEDYPIYSAGSLAGSAAFTVLTFGAGPLLVKGSRAALAAARGAKAAQEVRTVGSTAAAVIKVKPSSVRAVQVTSSGELIATTPSRGLTLFAKVKGKPVKSSQADIFAIEKGTEDIGYISAKTGKTAIITERIGEREGKELIKSNLAIESITDVYQSESKVLKQVAPPRVGSKAPKEIPTIVKSEKGGVKVAESQPVGQSIITFRNKDLLQSAANTAKRKKQIKDANDALAQIKGRGKGFRLFESKPFKAEKGSKAPLEVISIYRSDRELSAAQKIAIAEVTSGDKKSVINLGNIGLGGGASVFAVKGSLGLGGATGAERKARKDSGSESVEIVSVRSPPGFEIGSKGLSLVKSISKITLVPDTGARTRSNSTSKLLDRITGKSAIDIGSKAGTREATRQVTRQNTKNVLKVDGLLKTSTVTKEVTKQRTVQRQQRIITTKTRSFGFLNLKFPAGAFKKRASRKKSERGFTEVRGLGVNNLLAPDYSIAPDKKKQRKKLRKKRKR